MAENRTKKVSDIEQSIRQFPGPYVGYVKNPTDVNRMGRLFVHIPALHGAYDEGAKKQSAQTVPCSYCSPFAGQTPLQDTSKDPKKFSNTQKSYGFWMVPPDINTKVLVMFANGNVNDAYWIGCVFDDYMNNMTPGKASSQNFVDDNEQTKYSADFSSVPVAEAQRKAESSDVAPNTKAREDTKFTVRPVHVPETDTLVSQGLITDDVRGVTSSSARRETPSQVFGISTPGPIDFEGQKTVKRESINRHGKIYNDSDNEFDFNNVAHSRLGGNTFVMDDGTPKLREGNTDVTAIKDELIRLRTRSGAQLLLHNTEGIVYIINNDGTAWMEFSKNGKIDIYAKDSVSIHTENDFNLRAERDLNMEAGRNVNIKATGQNTGDKLVNSTPSATTGRVRIESTANTELFIGSDGLIKAGSNIKTFTGNDFLVNTDTSGEIHFNTDGKVTSSVLSALATYDITDSDTTKSITKRVPTNEPYREHENKPANTKPSLTDREQADQRFLG